MPDIHITRVPGAFGRSSDRFEVRDTGEPYTVPPGYRMDTDDIISPRGHRGYITEHKGRLLVCTMTGGEKPVRLQREGSGHG